MMSKKAKLTAIILAIMSSVVGITGCSMVQFQTIVKK